MIDDREIQYRSGVWRFLTMLLSFIVFIIVSYFVFLRFPDIILQPWPCVVLETGVATWLLIGYSYKCHKNHWKLLRYRGDNFWLWESDFNIMHNIRGVEDVRDSSYQ